MVSCRFGVVGVRYVACNLLLVGLDVNMDERRLRRTDAMLECILHKRDEHHGCHRHLRIDHGGLESDLDGFRQTEPHQVHVVLQETDLILQGNHGLLAVIEDVAQHLGEFLNGILCLALVKGRQGVDVVERVQQEVRIDLRTQVAQLSIHLGCFGILAGCLGLLPAHGQTDGGGNGGSNGEVEDVA